jgi:uncharacterized membrane protein
MWHMGDSSGKWMGFGWIWMILFIAVIGGWWIGFGSIWLIVPMAVIVWAILRVTERGGRRREPRRPVEPSAEEILEQRHAAGDLSDEQYETMRARLRLAG